MVYSEFHTLPPLKRFRFMQQRGEAITGSPPRSPLRSSTSCLPAKKRKESREFAAAAAKMEDPTVVRTYCLPTKKRVYVPHSDLSKALSPFDLNVEYKEEAEDGKTDIPPVKNMERCIEDCPEYDKENEFRVVEGNGNPEAEARGEKESHRKTPLEEPQEGTVGSSHESQSIVTENQEEEEGENGEEEEDDGILCAVCQSTDGDPSDPIVFCDGCDLMVHATCYGNPLIRGIPEGEWFCAQCLASKSSAKEGRAFSCCLCPVKEGPMKPTKDAQWAHVVCAILVPEVFFEDPEGREGIDCSKVPKMRRQGKCYVCRSDSGCVIQCSEPKCPLGFHITCGLNKDLHIEYKEGRKGGVVAGFCRTHTDMWKKQEKTGKFRIVARDEHKK